MGLIEEGRKRCIQMANELRGDSQALSSDKHLQLLNANSKYDCGLWNHHSMIMDNINKNRYIRWDKETGEKMIPCQAWVEQDRVKRKQLAIDEKTRDNELEMLRIRPPRGGFSDVLPKIGKRRVRGKSRIFINNNIVTVT
jgi:hypothetical protein